MTCETKLAPACPASPEDGLPAPRRYWAIATITIGLSLSVLSEGIANVALPTISKSLLVDSADSIWVINAYQLAVISALFPLSSLGQTLGFRRVYRAGLLVFTVGSLLCALSDSLTALTLARIVQGLGGAGIMSVNLALVRFIYPTRQLGRGTGLNALIVAISSAAAPAVASAILMSASWQWLFAVDVILGMLALAISARSLPKTRTSGRRPDMFSAALNALTFSFLVTGFKGFDGDHDAWLVALELAAGLVFGVVLVRRQREQAAPMLPLDLLRLPVFALSVAASAGAFAAYSICLVTMPFYLVDDLGRSQAQMGLLMTPWPLAIAVAAPAAGILADRYRPAALGAIGMAVFASGLALLAALPSDPTTFDIVLRTTLCGLGFGLFQSPNNKLMITSAPKERSGGVGGIQSTARLLGQVMGAAAVGLIFSFDPAHGKSTAFGLASVCAICACIASGLRLGKR
jgi:MFS transporter, DHA2 family, multidrug resistance protein